MESRIIVSAVDEERFDLVGTVDGSPVWATCSNRDLVCTRLLWERAERVVANGEVLGTEDISVPASLTGSCVVLFLTLLRACDRVDRTEMVTTLEGSERTGPYSVSLVENRQPGPAARSDAMGLGISDD